MSNRTHWSRAAERGSMLGLRITVACYRWFGRPLSLVLVHAIVAYFFLTGRAQRRASRAYLLMAILFGAEWIVRSWRFHHLSAAWADPLLRRFFPDGPAV